MAEHAKEQGEEGGIVKKLVPISPVNIPTHPPPDVSEVFAEEETEF